MAFMQNLTAVLPDYVRYLFIFMIVCGTASGLAGYVFAGLVHMSRNELTLVDPDSARAKFLVENIRNCRPLAKKLILTGWIFIGLAGLAIGVNRMI